MNTLILTALATGAAAQWWGGAPDCAVSLMTDIHSYLLPNTYIYNPQKK